MTGATIKVDSADAETPREGSVGREELMPTLER
jgi:hypothetical protein